MGGRQNKWVGGETDAGMDVQVGGGGEYLEGSCREAACVRVSTWMAAARAGECGEPLSVREMPG